MSYLLPHEIHLSPLSCFILSSLLHGHSATHRDYSYIYLILEHALNQSNLQTFFEVYTNKYILVMFHYVSD